MISKGVAGRLELPDSPIEDFSFFEKCASGTTSQADLSPNLVIGTRPFYNGVAADGLVSYDNDSGRRFLIWALCIGATNPDKCVEVEFYGQKILATFEADCSDLVFKGLCRVVIDVDDGYTLLGVTFKSETGIEAFSNDAQTLLDQPLVDYGGYGKVMKDSLTAFGRLWDAGLGSFLEQLWSNYCDLYISHSGYSLGGCLSQMAAVRFQKEQWWPADQMFYYGFGVPRCGNEDFAFYMDESVADAYRINWIQDNVPSFPTTSCLSGSSAQLGSCTTSYFHCCKTVHYSVYTSSLVNSFQQCDIPEDTVCQALTPTASDHSKYFQTTPADVDSLTCTDTKTFPDA
ncbi:unnamed protein product [Caenorhabditis auriculariae]|uniref:Fungal lipase-type domain-containing protein n=1 Tax=Caenorhabditis auriculariae TaxID=2777116 RepID=A0A8S1GPB9_9PELO|nr:unnamed protein product [Caenorhabditis auriculariae]